MDGSPITEPDCAQFLGHWRHIANGDSIPHTSNFLNTPDPDLIPFVEILELLTEGQLVRFMGTGLVDLWGADRTNQVFGESLPSEVRLAVESRSRTIADHPCGLVILADFNSPTGRPFSMESILLPLAVDDGKPKRLCSFSKVIETIARDDGLEARFQKARHETWLDIGFGVPNSSPGVSLNLS